MRTVTGVEIGLESCVVARVHQGSDGVRVSAVHGLGEADWEPDHSFAEHLRGLRRAGHYPRRARVVAWGVDGVGAATERMAQEAVAPLVKAGFFLDAVLSPAEALLALANSRGRAAGGGEVWLALNRAAAAIAIVDGGQLLFSREFHWNYRAAATVREELLQRYSLVSHLAPEIRHGVDTVRERHGAMVTAIVTCGDLPDLRSLAMPLIEELDMEVETLDTFEGISIEGAAAAANVETAPALRLISALALERPQARPSGARRLAAAAAAVVILLAGGWLMMRELRRSRPADAASSSLPAPTIPAVAEQEPVAPPPVAAEARPAAEPKNASDADTPAATTGRGETAAAGRLAVADPEVRRAPPRAVRRARVPLRDPLPAVNSILVAPDRRLAVANGEIVREGDTVGRRVLIRIEPGALVLREPSGLEVRVPIRRKAS